MIFSLHDNFLSSFYGFFVQFTFAKIRDHEKMLIFSQICIMSDGKSTTSNVYKSFRENVNFDIIDSTFS